MRRKQPQESHSGSTLDELLREDSTHEEVEAIAKKRVSLWQEHEGVDQDPPESK